MRTINISLLVEDEKFEKKMDELELRCKKVEVELDTLLQAVSNRIPNTPYVDILLSYADLEISSIERSIKWRNFLGLGTRTKR